MNSDNLLNHEYKSDDECWLCRGAESPVGIDSQSSLLDTAAALHCTEDALDDASRGISDEEGDFGKEIGARDVVGDQRGQTIC